VDDLSKLIKLKREAKEVSNKTRHSNFQIISGMYYDNISSPIFSIPLNANRRGLDSDQWDYVRFRTLELLAEELSKSSCHGSLAEVGVFRGDFAHIINGIFPKKKLYLFDTFAGFDEDSITKDSETGFTSSGFLNLLPEFKNTSVSSVLDKMPFPETCVICEGLFPESAKGLDDTFCLVSIDVDFYELTMDALLYFYPKLVKHGYILVHDYNHDELCGPKKAIENFQNNGMNLCKVPIADQCGTLILVKP